jgi:hypothetical protein
MFSLTWAPRLCRNAWHLGTILTMPHPCKVQQVIELSILEAVL